ncbi:hypothetical protein CSPX01_06417, partial [Colletotrichum filicis]
WHGQLQLKWRSRGGGNDWVREEARRRVPRRTNATLSVHTWYGCDPWVLAPLTKRLSRRRGGGSETGDMGHGSRKESRAPKYVRRAEKRILAGRDGGENGLKRMASAIARLLYYSHRLVERVTPEKKD